MNQLVSEELSLTEKYASYLKSHLSLLTSLYFIYNMELTMPTPVYAIASVCERDEGEDGEREKRYKTREK